ncbi:MAG: hypothetical protein KatS3mg076_3086 [Candidatus Binatia bacterium]|nr:MAG: hypothetical protein KatS3mg076_3086 [Candidatus Binatia bacterium]
MPPKGPEKSSTRDAILEVAEREFAARGYEGVTVRDIAARAGLRNQASLYNHFRNKEDLYEAVLARGIVPVIALVAETGATPGTADRDVLERLFDYLARHPHVPRLIHRAALDESGYLLDRVASQILRPLYNQGLDVLSRRHGPWEPADLPHVAAGIYHLLFGYFANASLLAALFGEDPMKPAVLERQLRFLQTAVDLLLGRPVASRHRGADRKVRIGVESRKRKGRRRTPDGGVHR